MRRPRRRAALLLTLACLAPAAVAAPLVLRLCTLDHPFPPHTMPDGSGQVQRLLRRAAAAHAVQLENEVAPRLRCLSRLQQGEVDAVLSAYLPERRAYGVFPMRGAQPDDTRSVAVVRFTIYRQAGGSLQWDGRQFTGLDQRPIGIQVGLAVTQRLRATGVRVDEGAKTIGQNLEKLVHGRVQAIVALEHEAQPLIAQRYAGRIQSVESAFASTPIYLHVHPAYYRRHQHAVEAMWQEVRRLRRQ